MLCLQTVDAPMLELIKKLMDDAAFNDFILVGGTALSLQIGHRKSIDIDLFTKQPFEHNAIMQHLSEKYNGTGIRHSDSAVYCKVNGIKIDLVMEPFLITDRTKTIEGIRMTPPEVIGAMKLQAIIDSGKRLKDFIDIHFLLEHFPLEKMTSMLVENYPDVIPPMVNAALLYHKEIEMNKEVGFIKAAIPFHSISERLHKAVAEQKKLFTNISDDHNKMRQGRRRGI